MKKRKVRTVLLLFRYFSLVKSCYKSQQNIKSPNMICPEIANFPPPKTMGFSKKKASLEDVKESVNMNSFYQSLVVTCPDEIQTPGYVEDVLTEDTDYYKLTNCSLTEFVQPTFIENFIKKGSVYCLSTDRDCVVQNCACITPDGILTLHILEFIYQTLGLQGTKRPRNFYEVKIDLNTLKHHSKLQQSLSKLELFNFSLVWEPHEESICPSSIAKYFCDQNIKVSVHTLEFMKLTPVNNEVPSIVDVDIEDMVEWIGLLAMEADLDEPELYISTYSVPESEFSLKTSRISLLIVKGFIPPSIVTKVCDKLSEFTLSRDLPNYWTALSVQSQEDSLWQWSRGSQKMFQAHDSSFNAFFTVDGASLYSIGQIKYS